MARLQYSLSWNSYKNNICTGFAELQQNQEFVDMTLVAGGHLVKVHKNLIALSSPYIKEIISTAPCEHPVIFLNNVSHEILCYLLEYIYTGEVKVDKDKIGDLLSLAGELKLCGLDKYVAMNEKNICHDDLGVNVDHQEDIPIENLGVNIYMEREVPNDNLQINVFNQKEILSKSLVNDGHNAKKVLYTQDINQDNQENHQMIEVVETNMPVGFMTNMPDFDTHNDSRNGTQEGMLDVSNSDITSIKIDSTGFIPQQYSVSNRGCLQLILNRYLYYMHNHAKGGIKRRWRCIDYRLKQCPAYIDTVNECITVRKNLHAHPYHDDKIIKKIKANQIYGTLSTAIHGANCLNEKSKTDSNIIT